MNHLGKSIRDYEDISAVSIEMIHTNRQADDKI